jgi:hypothetical protein
METYGDYIKVVKEESENSEEIQKKMNCLRSQEDSITYGNIGKAEDLMKDQVIRKVDANLLLVRREGKEAQAVLQEEQAANSLMGRIGTESEAESLSEDKSINEVFSIFTPSDIDMPLYLRY